MKFFSGLIFFLACTTFLQAQNLCGFWKSQEYPCIGGIEYFETFAISQIDNYVVCTKISGDECVTSGQVSWEGNFLNSTFPVFAYVGNEFQPNCCVILSTVGVESWYHLIFDHSINIWKFSCDEVDSMNFKYSDYNLNCNCHAGTGNISVSPNPFSDLVFINNNTSKEIQTVEIFNELGQRIFYQPHDVTEINLATFAPGIYLYNVVTNDSKSYRGKLIKN